MQTSAISVREDSLIGRPVGDTGVSAVSWAAVLAGAAGAAALTLLLSMLGFGLGLSAISPWSDRGADSASIGLASIAWIAFTQIFSAGLGGYLAGRLRVKWMDAQDDEIYFRDTAHGFLSWVIATLATVTLLGSVSAAVLNGGMQVAGSAAAGAGAVAGGAAATSLADGKLAEGNKTGNGSANPLQYFADVLFRAEPALANSAPADPAHAEPANAVAGRGAAAQPAAQPQPAANQRAEAAAEAVRIFAHDLRAGALSAEDKEYLGLLISRQTGIGQVEAEKRASDTFYQLTTSLAKAEMTAKEAADKARKAAAHTSLWMFVALLAGAFCASLSATFGGKQRDEI